MKNNASLIYNICLIIGDFLALIAAFVGAYLLRVTYSSRPLIAPVHARTYISVFLVLLPFWILIFALLGLYNSNIYEKRFSEFGRLLIGSFIGMLFVIFWNFIASTPILPARSVPLIGFGLGFVFIILFRNLARLIRGVLFDYRVGITNVLIIGNTKMSTELVSSLVDSRVSGYRVLGLVGSKSEVGQSPHTPSFTTFAHALDNLKADQIHGIIQTELYAEEDRNREILDFAQSNHISYRFVPGNNELFVGNIDVELFRSSIPVIAVHQTALFGWGRIAKRLFDLIVGTILFVIALPFMLIIAIVIAIFGHGPILFLQPRLTRYNTTIKIFKFRTLKKEYNDMLPETAFEKMGKPELSEKYRENGDQLPHDPRVSKIGNFLRRSSLDELPQLINVIRGDISLVGPRALIVDEMNKYAKKNLILSVKSGLTGLSQVSGRRNLSFEERRKLDLYYVQNWSFWLDLTILVKTVRAILGGRGAV